MPETVRGGRTPVDADVTRHTWIFSVVALVVLLVELGATVGTVTGEPFVPVDGWGPTRPADALAFAVVVLGCGALAALSRFPIAAAATATVAYVVFALRDHELGLFLPPMVAVLTLSAQDRSRLAALGCAVASLAAALVWVAHRTAPIAESGVALLARVAFGTVLTVFFCGPLLVGELVRTRTQLRRTDPRWAPTPP